MSAPEHQVGLLTTETSPLFLDHVRAANIPLLVLDAEHTGLRPDECSSVVRAFAGSTTQVAVRVPDMSHASLAAFANTGADELILPQVRTPEDVASSWMRLHYPPLGYRSRQPSPANGYGQRWPEPKLSAVIETVAAVDAAEELAKSEYLCGVWIGITDLRDDLARSGPGRMLGSVVEELFACFATVGVGMPVPNRKAADTAFRNGATRCLVYWDVYLHDALTALREGETA